MIHELKETPEFFSQLWEGVRTAELRLNDRDYQVYDRVRLLEWSPESGYTGSWVSAQIKGILFAEDYPEGLREGYCLLSLGATSRGVSNPECLAKSA
jgi:Domain of unknown function (DUF3850)